MSSIVHGGPAEWFGAHGWRTFGANEGMEWTSVTRALLDLVHSENADHRPGMCWFRTRKGREYGIYDNKSHGTPHKPMNSPGFWNTKRPFMEKYGIEFEGYGEGAPDSHDDQVEQTRVNLEKVFQLYDKYPELLDYVSETLVGLGEAIPEEKTTLFYNYDVNPFKDPALTDYTNYPEAVSYTHLRAHET